MSGTPNVFGPSYFEAALLIGDYLIQYTVIHEEKKQIKCEIWDYRSSVKDSVNSHVASVHEGTILSNVLTAPKQKDKLKYSYWCNSSRKGTP